MVGHLRRDRWRLHVRSGGGLTYYGSNPTLPWYIMRDGNGQAIGVTQDPAYADTPPEDTVAPAWIAADRCRRKRKHEPHTWGIDSPFRCTGIPAGKD